MNKNYEGFVDLLVSVTGEKKDDILPLRKEDVGEIDSLIESLGKGGVGSKHSYKDALDLRFGLNGEQYTFKKAAQRLSVSPSAVRVKVEVALRKLRHPSRIRKLKKFFRSYIRELEVKNCELYAELLVAQKTLDKIVALVYPSGISTNINELKLSVRTYNVLRNLGVQNIGDLMKYTEKDLLKAKYFGRKCLRELQVALAEHRVSLRQK